MVLNSMRLGLIFAFLALPVMAVAQEVPLSANKAAETVAIRNLSINDSTVSGELQNKSPHTVRDIELSVRYNWLWKNEFHPGTNSPGRTVYYTVKKDIPPGQSVAFSYSPEPPLPARSDGQFMPEVSVAGFTVVIPQTAPGR